MRANGIGAPKGSGTSDEAAFARLYAEHGRAILAYALRRTSPEDAADVVADTFLVAWRRLRELPAGEEARLWLYGVARHTLANQQRGLRRQALLAQRLQRELGAAAGAVTQPPPGRENAAVRRALERLGRADREVLLLAGWEELPAPQIARVLGISAVAVRSRLHRARRRLRRELDAAMEETSSDARPARDWEFEEAR